MNLRDQTTDQHANEHGRWFDFDEETSCQIAAFLSVDHRKMLVRLRKKFKREIKTEDPAGLDRMAIEGMAEAILVSWRGMKDGEATLEPTLENKIRVLTASRPFREWVNTVASDTANFLAQQEEADQVALKSSAGVAAPVGS